MLALCRSFTACASTNRLLRGNWNYRSSVFKWCSNSRRTDLFVRVQKGAIIIRRHPWGGIKEYTIWPLKLLIFSRNWTHSLDVFDSQARPYFEHCSSRWRWTAIGWSASGIFEKLGKNFGGSVLTVLFWRECFGGEYFCGKFWRECWRESKAGLLLATELIRVRATRVVKERRGYVRPRYAFMTGFLYLPFNYVLISLTCPY